MKQFFCTMLVLTAVAATAQAQAFIYTPRNPAFGGNTFNYSWMLSSAQAQDRTVDPAQQRAQANAGRTTNSTLDAFSQSIQNQLLSRLTRNLIGNQFGEGELKPGTYRFGDFQVEITNAADGVQVRIVDGRGGETTLTIPYF